jgi:hypothetical protein
LRPSRWPRSHTMGPAAPHHGLLASFQGLAALRPSCRFRHGADGSNLLAPPTRLSSPRRPGHSPPPREGRSRRNLWTKLKKTQMWVPRASGGRAGAKMSVDMSGDGKGDTKSQNDEKG